MRTQFSQICFKHLCVHGHTPLHLYSLLRKRGRRKDRPLWQCSAQRLNMPCETGMDPYTLKCIRQVISENLMYSTGNST